MKKMRGIICALLLMMFTAVTVHADEGVSQKPDFFTDYYMIVESAQGGINIYSEADYESSKLNDTLIPNGTAIRIEGERTGKDNKDWGYTRYHGMYGYVPFDDLKPVTAAEAIESEYNAFGGTDVDFDVTVKTENGGTVLYGGPGEKFGEVSSMSTYHYLIAIVIGLIFTICLFYLYKLMMKLNHGYSNEIDINGCTCSILINLNDGHYKVLVNTPVGLLEKIITSNDHNLKIGSLHKISKDEQGIYYI